MRVPWNFLRFAVASRCIASVRLQHGNSPYQLHPSVKDFAAELAETQPCFRMPSQVVKILSRPKDFYELLLNMIVNAKERIFLSSLYIGSADNRLLESIKVALNKTPALQLYLHLDYNRATRPGPDSTELLLSPLLEQYPGRVHVYLFKSPKLKGIAAKAVPRRFDEGWGTWHAKIYGIDDEVIISGANLNDSYFTNRQDRYLHFGSPTFAQYCFDFLRVMRKSCYVLESTPSGSSQAPQSSSLVWKDAAIHPQHIESTTGSRLRDFQSTQRLALQNTTVTQTEGDVMIFPIIQGGQFNIREEERCLASLFKWLSAYSASSGQTPYMHLTSGYFGLSEDYQELVNHSPVDCQLLCASPLANGFYGSRGISGRIPEGYTYLEQRFMRLIGQSGRTWDGQMGVNLNEWARPGWTYHAKGIWMAPSRTELPVLTVFGSTNLNSRSANLDTELSFVMIASTADESKGLREALKREVDGLWQYAEPWRGAERKVRIGTKFLVKLVGGML